jgi:hypothetical protein
MLFAFDTMSQHFLLLKKAFTMWIGIVEAGDNSSFEYSSVLSTVLCLEVKQTSNFPGRLGTDSF